MRRRLDTELVRRGMLTSRSQATVLIERGEVLVGGVIALKASRLVAPGEPIELRHRPRFVSRGGEKLAGALDAFDISVGGLRCLDAGSSTGGFVDCLLQQGARDVVAVDVGRGQLDVSLREDPRVSVLEGVNARHLTLDDVDEPVDVVTADLSFISLTAVAPALRGVAAQGATGILLVKPQFEAGPERVGRGGIVRDPDVHRDVLRQAVDALSEAGWGPRALVTSSIRGAGGNLEFFVHAGAGAASELAGADVDRAVAAAHEHVA